MNQKLIDKCNISTIVNMINMILSINNTTKIVQSISILHSSCISPLFEIEVLPDCKQNNINRFHLFHDGLGLPDKLYYKY